MRGEVGEWKLGSDVQILQHGPQVEGHELWGCVSVCIRRGKGSAYRTHLERRVEGAYVLWVRGPRR